MSTNIANCPLWIFRCNFKIDNPAYQEKEGCYKKNLCPILILENETWDQYCYDKLVEKGESKNSIKWEDYINFLGKNTQPQKVKTINKPPYLLSFSRLHEQSRESDILVVLEYSETKYRRKMGIIKKGTTIEEIKRNRYKIYAFPLCDVQEIDSKYDAIFRGLLPMNLTASALSHHVQGVKCVFERKRPNNISLDVLSNSQIEELCFIWLTRLAPHKIRMTRPIVYSGKGNIPTIDILGLNQDKDILAVQVSYTSQDQLILDKIGKLLDFVGDLRVICVNPNDEKELINKVENKYRNHNNRHSLEIISLSRVWNDCVKDKECKSKIDKMIDELYVF